MPCADGVLHLLPDLQSDSCCRPPSRPPAAGDALRASGSPARMRVRMNHRTQPSRMLGPRPNARAPAGLGWAREPARVATRLQVGTHPENCCPVSDRNDTGKSTFLFYFQN